MDGTTGDRFTGWLRVFYSGIKNRILIESIIKDCVCAQTIMRVRYSNIVDARICRVVGVRRL